MQAFTRHTGIVFPMDQVNVDTDAILPKQYLKAISKTGYGGWLFDDLRYLDPGDVGTDLSIRRLNPAFLLNSDKYSTASILLARENFGCGSSREHAVWALTNYGMRAVIAPSFADIFYSNCFKNGFLPVTLPSSVIDELFTLCESSEPLEITIDLQYCEVRTDEKCWTFTLDETRRKALLNGSDDIALTLIQAGKIKRFEKMIRQREPWLNITE